MYTNPVSQKEMENLPEYKEWLERGRSKGCWGCGCHDHLDRHHIVKPGRSWEICNLVLLCRLCHGAAEGQRQNYHGTIFPPLSLSHVLWIKRMQDRPNYDRKRLGELYGQKLPRAYIPPSKLYFHRMRRPKAW